MPTIVITPGSPLANSYVDVPTAVDYLKNQRAYSEPFWNAGLTVDQQSALLMWATSLLDTSFSFPGAVLNQGQSLRWPRVGVVDEDGRYVDQMSIPQRIQRVTAVLALDMASRDPSQLPDVISQGLRSLSLGPISLTIDPSLVLPMIPDFVIAMMGVFGEIKGIAAGSHATSFLKIRRT